PSQWECPPLPAPGELPRLPPEERCPLHFLLSFIVEALDCAHDLGAGVGQLFHESIALPGIARMQHQRPLALLGGLPDLEDDDLVVRARRNKATDHHARYGSKNDDDGRTGPGRRNNEGYGQAIQDGPEDGAGQQADGAQYQMGSNPRAGDALAFGFELARKALLMRSDQHPLRGLQPRDSAQCIGSPRGRLARVIDGGDLGGRSLAEQCLPAHRLLRVRESLQAAIIMPAFPDRRQRPLLLEPRQCGKHTTAIRRYMPFRSLLVRKHSFTSEGAAPKLVVHSTCYPIPAIMNDKVSNLLYLP